MSGGFWGFGGVRKVGVEEELVEEREREGVRLDGGKGRGAKGGAGSRSLESGKKVVGGFCFSNGVTDRTRDMSRE